MLLRALTNRWHAEGGYRELLKIALPLVASMGVRSIQLFVDRVFLGWYSGDTMAASAQAGIMGFTVIVLFMDTAAYCNTFVAQYVGAGLPRRVGVAVWQGAFFALVATVVFLTVAALARPLFDLIGHGAEVRGHETTYFRITVGGAGFMVLSAALASFFTGRGNTITVMLVTVLSVVVNVTLNYLWIFGRLGFPEMGIAGAAWATVTASAVGAVAYLFLMLRRTHRASFGILSGFRFDKDIFLRLIRFGLPAGLSGMLEVLVWATFLAFIGRLGSTQLKATTAAFTINNLAFMPMFGMGVAISTLVGRRQGERRSDTAASTVWSGIHLVTLYMGTLVACYLLLPRVFLAPIAVNADPADFRSYAPATIVLLRFVALYTLFDGLNISLVSALRGAGDTRFPLVATTAISYTIVAMPSWILYATGQATLYRLWAFATTCVILLSFVMLLRFLGGKWRSMRVIEEELAPPHVTPRPDVPPLDVE
jgi:MATE family multidrug resistance protein